MPKFSYWSSSSMNCFFVLFRNSFRYRGFWFICRTRPGQYCGKNTSIFWIGRVGIGTEGGGGGGEGEALARGGGAGDLRSITGGGWFRSWANWLLALASSSSNFLRRFLSSL
jgi:hypothetical protein